MPDDLLAVERLHPVVREHHEIGPEIDWAAMGPVAARTELLRQLDRNFARWGEHFPAVAAEFDDLATGTATIPGDRIHAAVTHAPVRLRIFHPAPGTRLGVHLVLHGGGWRSGSIDEQCTVHAARRIATEARVAVVTAEYRLAPEHPWPAGLIDVLDTIEYLADRAGALDLDPAALTLGGASAGANLATAASLADAAVPIRGLVLEVPALDLTGGIMTAADARISLDAEQGLLADYVPDPDRRRDPLVSPLLVDDARRFPASWLVSAGLDPLRHDAAAFAARLRAAGVAVQHTEIAGALHGSGLLTGAWPPARRWQDAVVAAVSAAHGRAGRN